jgi:Carboxypeptidase regulatory-like domain/TonB-dependent Receptor Plug Domain
MPLNRAVRVFAGLALVLTTTARAQSLSGVLRDSLLYDGPLPNATVWIEGVHKETKTDLLGRFKFDSLPPGTYRLSFNHPAFDAAGVGAPRWKLELPAQGLQGVLLATPSPDTRYARLCPTARTADQGYIVGAVRDAAADTGVVGAVVNVMWTQISVSRTSGVQTLRKNARADTDRQGQFVLCGVPVDGDVTAWATFGTASTGLITLSLGKRTLAAREFFVATKTLEPTSTAADTAALGARLDGIVRNIDGEPIPDARVYVRGNRTIAKTTASGAFSLGALPGGTQVVEATAVGYQPNRQTVDLKPGVGRRAEIVLGKTVQRLPTVEVVGKLGNDESSFLDRARRGFGYFITEDDIKRRGPIIFEDIIRTVPGMQVVPVGQGYRIISSRGQADLLSNCSPQYFLDGSPFFVDVSNGDPFPVNPTEIQAIEVYAGTAGVPVEFQRMQNGGCGVIAIWTKRGGVKK